VAFTLLSDLVGNTPGAETARELTRISSGSPLLELKDYFRAIWEVGGRLQKEGLLTNVRFEAEDLHDFLAYLDNNVGASQAQRMITEMRRFPKEILRFAGTLTVPKLIELVESHLAVRANSA
jgi:hypothetical protein